MVLLGQVAWVSGAGTGFGSAIARRLAQDGARVACLDIDGEAADRCADSLDRLGLDAMALACDVADSASVAAAAQAVARRWAHITTVVNNAGVSQTIARMDQTPEAEIDRIFAVNVKSLQHVAVHLLPFLRAGGGGTVINIASVGGMRPRPGMAWYNASKAAVISLTQSMALEYARHAVRVNAIAPVAARTPMLETMLGETLEDSTRALAASIPLGRLAEPEDITAAVSFLASPSAAFMTGVVLPVDGGRLIS